MKTQELNKTRLRELISKYPYQYNRMIQKDKDLMNWIDLNTTPLRDTEFKYSITTKCYWILNDIHEFPLCKTCGKPLIHRNVKSINMGYKKYCSHLCSVRNLDTNKKRENTNRIKYGCKCPLQNDMVHKKTLSTINQAKTINPKYTQDIQTKARLTKFEKYGNENFNNREKCRNTVQTKLYDDPEYYNKINTKGRKTRLERYGDENFNNREQAKNTCIQKYGVDNPFKSEIIQTKIKETCLQKYGVDNPFKSKVIRDKIKSKILSRYGVESALQSDEIRDKIATVCLEKYGHQYPLSNKIIQAKGRETKFKKYGDVNFNNPKKCKQTCLTKYGVSSVNQVKEIRQKIRQTCEERFGGPTPLFSNDVLNTARKRYFYNGISFDSAPELAIYLFLLENNIDFEYHPNIRFEYFVDGKLHYYFPDFRVEDEIWEIKGDHFFNEHNQLINPYDREKPILQEKQDCMLNNHVIILRKNEYLPFINYILKKYGKNFFIDHKTNR